MTALNNEECAYDDGDCCECECQVGNRLFTTMVVTCVCLRTSVGFRVALPQELGGDNVSRRDKSQV